MVIPIMSALPGSGVTLTGRGPDDFHQVRFPEVEGHGSGVGFFHSPGLYKGEHKGARGRRGQTGAGRWRGRTNRTELGSELRGEKSDRWWTEQGRGEGSVASQRAKWGPPPKKGRRGGHSQEEFAGASAVQSVNSLDGASAIPLSLTELCAERAPVTPVSPGGHRHC